MTLLRRAIRKLVDAFPLMIRCVSDGPRRTCHHLVAALPASRRTGTARPRLWTVVVYRRGGTPSRWAHQFALVLPYAQRARAQTLAASSLSGVRTRYSRTRHSMVVFARAYPACG